ncbi:PREDICTED: RNA polymerase II degradation factor 1-like isoform X2 [Brassica oleracea var. oleracea]|uniref:GBF-interacting protein 1 N-terminal domain-containing protein n=1 Tax=Brassica oleracea var. oleracea TaxID=109376 RepID=A0A0D3BIU2_BRAOL|nr:PREDICTED: RNA polymerase II degradation factor 1-like isoform X2 [Brassica oleracea var. oleracea]
MSSGKVIGGGGGGGGARKGNNDIPSGSRKIVQSLKEIVNAPEAEIYAMLKECNMDPNEAVHRLLSQDPFHEVKSKKEKKKETRDVPDYRLRGANNTYNRGGRGGGGSDRYAGRSGSAHLNSTDSGNFQGKSTNKRENGTQGYTSSWSSSSGVANQHQTPHSDSVVTENKLPPAASSDGISSSQPASGNQTPWFGAPGQMSMADIVKRGIPQSKTTNSQRSEINHEHEVNANHQVPVKDEWPSIEKPLAPITSSVSVAPAESEACGGAADFQSERVDQQHLRDRLENIQLEESDPSEDLGVDHVQPGSVGNVQEEDSGVSSESNDNQYTYETQSHPVEHHKDEDEVSSGSANSQELTVDGHDQEASHEDDRRAVVIPKHLLIHTEECSQLSFGSFGGFGSRPLSNNAEETPDVAPQIEHSDARNTEFYGDERLGSTVNGSMGHAPAAGSYDDSLESRREVLKQENPETVQENQYAFAQSEPEYAKQQQQQLNTAYDTSQTNAQNQMQNLASLSNVMGYPHSDPNSLLAQNARELEFQYSNFAQSMQSRNSNNASSLGGQSISMPEALRGSGTPATQPMQQNLQGANIATGPALPQQLPQMHPYSQPTMPLAHFANMISYPLIPQNYPYMPSAFQQTYAGNTSYHQQLAALLPQYKTNLSPSNLPQSATAPASAYGFGNSTNVGSAGNFPINQQQSAPTGYEDVLSSQYKESNHLLALQHQQQQNENSAMWHHGHGSRTMSGVPANTYYNLQAQQQQLQQTQQAAAGGYRQAQQQQQQRYGSHGYPNFYQSQTEMSLERQQQNPRDGAGAQVGQQTSDQTQQQLWQNSY